MRFFVKLTRRGEHGLQKLPPYVAAPATTLLRPGVDVLVEKYRLLCRWTYRRPGTSPCLALVGFLLTWPLGWLSDRLDRRLAIIGQRSLPP